MNAVQAEAFEAEISSAKTLLAKGELAAGFSHLERAHVIGQAHVLPHMRSHWLMLQVELRLRRPVAALGQAVRIVLGGIGSAVGVIPVGNTGGSDISMFRRLPVAPELQDLIDGRRPDDDRKPDA